MSQNSTYSDWYYQYRSELSDDYNGSMYGNHYKKHLALWLRVEGMTQEQVNHNPNKILTVPVSGKLETQATHFAILSDEGIVPEKITIGEKTYVKSTEVGAEKTYTVASEQPVVKQIIAVEKAVLPSLAPINNVVTAPVASSPISHFALLEVFIMFDLLLVVTIVSFGIFVFIGKKEVKTEKLSERTDSEVITSVVDEECEENKPVRVFVIRDEDESLLNAITVAGDLKVCEGNKIYLPLTEDGRVIIPGNVPVKNINKNVRDGLIQAYLKQTA